jgi:hypothetical protein
MPLTFWGKVQCWLLGGAILGLAAVAILSGALAKARPKDDSKPPSITVVMPPTARTRPSGAPNSIPDAILFPL